MTQAQHNLDEPLLSIVTSLEAECGGRLCFAFEEIGSGKRRLYRGDEKCKTASIIKLPMLVHVASSVYEGHLSWEQPVVLTDAEKVGGSGVLSHMTEGLTLSLRDACVLMTIVSDNTATNMVIEALGTAPINARIRSFGMQVTQLFRKAYSPDTPQSAVYGLGVTTPNEMCELMVRLSLVASAGSNAASEVLHILANQAYRDCIPRSLPSGWRYAGKTGSLDQVRNDVGLITGPDGRKFALAVFCQELPTVDWSPDNAGTLAIANLAQALLIE